MTTRRSGTRQNALANGGINERRPVSKKDRARSIRKKRTHSNLKRRVEKTLARMKLVKRSAYATQRGQQDPDEACDNNANHRKPGLQHTTHATIEAIRQNDDPSCSASTSCMSHVRGGGIPAMSFLPATMAWSAKGVPQRSNASIAVAENKDTELDRETESDMDFEDDWEDADERRSVDSMKADSGSFISDGSDASYDEMKVRMVYLSGEEQSRNFMVGRFDSAAQVCVVFEDIVLRSGNAQRMETTNLPELQGLSEDPIKPIGKVLLSFRLIDDRVADRKKIRKAWFYVISQGKLPGKLTRRPFDALLSDKVCRAVGLY